MSDDEDFTGFGSCGCCRYWEKGRSVGDCRRRAPSPNVPRWPGVKATDWCGEWAQMVSRPPVLLHKVRKRPRTAPRLSG